MAKAQRMMSLCVLLTTYAGAAAMQLRGGQPATPAPAPEHVDHERVEKFSEVGDIDGLHTALVEAFNASARVQGHKEVSKMATKSARIVP
jgi:hypothetical protein